MTIYAAGFFLALYDVVYNGINSGKSQRTI